MMWKLATRGNSEHGFARALRMGIVDAQWIVDLPYNT